VIATTASNILDWRSAYEFRMPLTVLQALTVPTQLVCGALSHPAVRRANELLSVHLGCASFLSIPGAAHFMIATHPKDVADLLRRHIIAANASLSKACATHV
jgi:pimeloyl-ACP methyl ester carboxylesterase